MCGKNEKLFFYQNVINFQKASDKLTADSGHLTAGSREQAALRGSRQHYAGAESRQQSAATGSMQHTAGI